MLFYGLLIRLLGTLNERSNLLLFRQAVCSYLPEQEG